MRFIAQVVMRSSFEDVLERTLAAERAGFSAVLVPDHFHVPQDRMTPGGIAESWATLAALAARTERVRLGGAVMCNNFRHPCLTAQIAATVDQISHGRLEIGLGAGWLEEEFRRTGIPFPRPGVRIAMLEEALQIVLPALEGKTVTFRGEHYDVRDFVLEPGSVQKPRPPLHIGGGGDRLLRLAGRYADIVSLVPPVPHGRVSREEVVKFSAERISERIGFLRRAAEAEGRDPSSIEVAGFSGIVHVAESEAQATKTLEGMSKMFGVGAEEVRDHPMTLVGTPAQMVESLERRRENWGIDAQMIGVQSVETAEVFGKEIIPRLS